MPVPFKRVVFRLHWLLGLSAGLILSLVGSTGALMAFKDECLDVLNPQLDIPAEGRTALGPDALLQKAHDLHPEFAPAGLTWTGRGQAVEVRLGGGRGPGGGRRVLLDPYTGAELEPAHGAEFFATVEQLHKNLAIGPVGKQLVGASTICIFVFGLSGLFLRWPRHKVTSPKTWLAVDPRLKGRGFLRNLHFVAGTWLFLLHAASALTGLWFAYDFYRAGVSALVGAPLPQRGPRGDGPKAADAAKVSLDLAWQTFLANAPTATRAMVNLPREAGAPIEVRYLEAASPHPRAFSSLSFSADGHPAGSAPYADLPRGQRFVAAMFPLHSGEFFGLPGRIAMLLGALSMPFFCATGMTLWIWRRRLAKRPSVAPSMQPAALSADDDSAEIVAQ